MLAASQIVAGPVTLIAGPRRLKLPRWRLAQLLDLLIVAGILIAVFFFASAAATVTGSSNASGAGIRTLNLAVNRSLRPIQK